MKQSLIQREKNSGKIKIIFVKEFAGNIMNIKVLLFVLGIFFLIFNLNFASAIEFRDSDDTVNIYLNDSSGDLNLTRGNLTVGHTGFFGWLGNLASRVTKLWTVNLNINNTIEFRDENHSLSANDTSIYYYNGSTYSDLTSGEESYFTRNATGNFTYLENSQDNVGIGTDNPLAKLHISNGDSGATPYSQSDFILEDDDHFYVNFITPTDKEAGFLFSDANHSIEGQLLYSHLLHEMQFYVNATKGMVIAGSGNVGIGSSSPNERLEVVGNLNVTGNITADSIFVSNSSVYIGGLKLSNVNGDLQWNGSGVNTEIAVWQNGTYVSLKSTVGQNLNISGDVLMLSNLSVGDKIRFNDNVNQTIFVNATSTYYFNGTSYVDLTSEGDNYWSRNATSNVTSLANVQDNVELANNLTVTGTGSFGWLGSLASRITTLFVEDINFNGTINGTGSIITTGNLSVDDIKFNNNVNRTLSANDTTLYYFNGSDYIDITSEGSNYWARNSTSNVTSLGTSQDNVGIGTSTPSQKLHVEGNLNVTGSIYTNSSSLYLGTGKISFNESGNAFVYYNESGGSVLPSSGSVWSENGSDVYYDGGNVGIGTSNPSYKLQVAGGVNLNNTFYVNESTGNVGIGIVDPGANLPANFDSNGQILEMGGSKDAGITFRRVDGTNGFDIWTDYGSVDLYIDSRRGDSMSDIFFRTRTKGTIINAMTIKSDGSIGIGMTSPSNTFDVNGKFVVNGTSGNVGIGTSSPDKLLHLGDNTNNINGELRFEASDGDLVDLGITTSDEFYITGGNVGIGTTNPAYPFHVTGTAYFETTTYLGSTSYYVDSSGNAKFLDLQVADTSNPGLTVGNGATGYLKVGGSTISDNSGDLILDSDSGEIYIPDEVGIGTQNPSNLLHLNSAASGDAKLQFTYDAIGSGSSDGTILYQSGGEFIINSQEPTSGTIGFNIQGTRVATITNNQNLKMGSGHGILSPTSGGHHAGIYYTYAPAGTSCDTDCDSDDVLQGFRDLASRCISAIGYLNQNEYLCSDTSDSRTCMCFGQLANSDV